MGARGAFLAITTEQVQALTAVQGDDMEVKETIWEMEGVLDSDKRVFCDSSWDALHRCLTDGQLEVANGPYPFNHVVLGPRQLHEGDDYIISLVFAEEVRDVAKALEPLTEQWFRDKYFTILPKDYALEYGQQDFEYTWSYFEEVRDLYLRAAAAVCAVVFEVGL